MSEVLEAEIAEDEEMPDMGVNVLTEQQMKFAQAIVDGKGMSDAYKLAYPERSDTKYVSQYAYRILKSPKVRQEIEVLQQAARMKFLLDSPRAAEKLMDLSKNAKSEKVQLEATKDILNRGGLQPPHRVETVAIGIFGSASQEDIRAILRRQMEDKEEEE